MMDKNIDKVIQKIKDMNNNSCDINTHEITISGKKIVYIYLESTSSDDKISDFLGKSLSQDAKLKKKNLFENIFKELENTIPNSKLKKVDTYDDLFYHLASGFTCVFIEGYNQAIALETKAQLDRSIDKSSGEPVLRGPRDSFNENYQTNIGLIRKRIKDPNLIFEETKVGKRTKTKVSVTYIKDIVDEKKVKNILKKLNDIDIDGIIDSSYLRELIIENTPTTFPQIVSTERPDLVCMSLLNGKIALVVENTPYALIIPAIFSDFFMSPEDYYSKPINASITRILRYLAFIIAITIPGLYIAITTYDMEVIPNLLLISFAIQKEGVPFPTIIEVFILVIAYEILKEADTRKPQMMGASISIVGALILGEAAVSAGIISPIVVIVISISAVAGMTFSDPDMTNAIRYWRIIYMLAGCIFGLIGILIVSIIFIAKLCSLESFGTPFMTPLAPFSLSNWKWTFLRFPQPKLTKRPSFLTDKNQTRLENKK